MSKLHIERGSIQTLCNLLYITTIATTLYPACAMQDANKLWPPARYVQPRTLPSTVSATKFCPPEKWLAAKAMELSPICTKRKFSQKAFK